MGRSGHLEMLGGVCILVRSTWSTQSLHVEHVESTRSFHSVGLPTLLGDPRPWEGLDLQSCRHMHVSAKLNSRTVHAIEKDLYGHR